MIYSTPNFTLAVILEMLEPNMTWGEGRSEKEEKKDANEKSKGAILFYKIAGACGKIGRLRQKDKIIF